MLNVGQKLWFVPYQKYHGPAREVEVQTVGRKWATATTLRNRINIENLTVDDAGYMSTGQCYLSEQEYNDTVGFQNEWQSFVKRVSHIRIKPEHITRDDLNELKRILKMEAI